MKEQVVAPPHQFEVVDEYGHRRLFTVEGYIAFLKRREQKMRAREGRS